MYIYDDVYIYSHIPPSSPVPPAARWRKEGSYWRKGESFGRGIQGTGMMWLVFDLPNFFWLQWNYHHFMARKTKGGGFGRVVSESGMRIFAGGLTLPIGLQSFQWLSRGKPFNVNPVHLWNWDCTAAAPNKAEVFRFPDVLRFSVTVAELAKRLLVVPCGVEQHHQCLSSDDVSVDSS